MRSNSNLVINEIQTEGALNVSMMDENNIGEISANIGDENAKDTVCIVPNEVVTSKNAQNDNHSIKNSDLETLMHMVCFFEPKLLEQKLKI
jgi:hypothetical protein